MINQELQSFLETAKQELIRGCADKKHPFRYPVIGTIDDGFPALRTVVLRKFDSTAMQLFVYTDYRSHKIEELSKNDNLTFLFYHPKKQLQLRVRTKVLIERQTERTAHLWNSMPDFAKNDYLTITAPGSVTEHGDIFYEKEKQSQNFCVLNCTIQQIDYLKLSREGHKRCLIKLEEGKVNSIDYLVP